MDPILGQLSGAASQSLGKTDIGKNLQINSNGAGIANRFFDLMTEKSGEQLQKTLLSTFEAAGGSGPQSIPANDLEITVVDPAETELHAVSTDKNSLTNMLAGMNGDFNRMDRMVETIASGNQRFSYKDLISMQMFMGKSVVAVETLTRVAEQGAKAFNSAYNMQV